MLLGIKSISYNVLHATQILLGIKIFEFEIFI